MTSHSYASVYGLERGWKSKIERGVSGGVGTALEQKEILRDEEAVIYSALARYKYTQA